MIIVRQIQLAEPTRTPNNEGPVTKPYLTYAFFDEGSWRPAFDPEKSDLITNLSVMEQVVGTLIKYGAAGEYEPYLAVEWASSDQDRVWNFSLRPGLKTQDGELINASTMRDSLLRSLRCYAKRQDPPVFDQLQGWADWKIGKSDKIGIEAISSHTLQLRFATRVFGLLEWLSMPYYGFLASQDWSGNAWANGSQITASGAYQVEEVNDRSITLRKRHDWFSHDAESPHRVTFVTYKNIEDLELITGPLIVLVSTKSPQISDDRFSILQGTPTNLQVITLASGQTSGPLRDPLYRRRLAARIRQFSTDNPPHNKTAATGLYKDTVQEFFKADSVWDKIPDLNSFEVVFLEGTSVESRANILDLLRRVLQPEGIEPSPHPIFFCGRQP